MEYKSNHNVVYSCKYHVVWCPKYRRQVLVKPVDARLKTHTLRKEFPSLATRLPTLWSNSYFVSTVGGSPLAIVKQYIENQKRSER